MGKLTIRLFSVFLAVSLMLTAQGARPAYAAGYVVNSLADNTTADAFCTLREAILAANNAPANANCDAGSAAADVITFSVSGTITLGSTLPNIVSGQGALTIDGGGNIIISGNNSVQVMGVNSGANLTLQNLTIANGQSSTVGGGIVNGGTLTVTNSTFSGNSASDGGGVYNGGTLTVSNATFSGNSANFGGGVFNDGGTLTVSNATFSGNSASISGGGVYNNGGTLTVSNATFSGNSANYGGGVFNAGTLTVSNATFSGNSANYGGGIHVFSGTATLKNTIIANNTSGGDCSNSATLTADAFNIDSDGSCDNATTRTAAEINLQPLTNNGGPTQTMAIGAGSAAIDAGDNSACPIADQRGVARPQGAGCDVGAYEAVVVTLFISGAGSGSGVVTSVPSGINCTITAGSASGNCFYSALPGSNPTVTLTATAAPGSTFAGWSGDPDCSDGSVTINTSKSCVATFTLAGNPPTVSGVAATGAGTLLQGQALASGPSQFTVTFNQDVTAASAENTANYLLVRAGGNGVQTLSCAGGVSGGDTSISIDSAVYAPATYTTTLNVNGGQPLPAGLYRLFVCGTTSIVNANGDELYAGLTDYGLIFMVTSSTTGGGGGSGGTGSGSSGTSGGSAQLPATGFAPNRVTSLPPQPVDKAYSETDLTLEIPSLGVNAPIVGVLKSGGTWDVSWLGNSVGWLEGSAYPTWQGNTVLTGHVWNADNTPGVFANIKDLKYGDRFTIRAYGQTYVYEVRENTWLWGASRVDKVFKHEEYDWVTLLTCEGYNSLSGNYLFRRMVRAVLVEVSDIGLNGE